jgi:hypothetical protein
VAKLADFLRSGAISREQFDQQKARLLRHPPLGTPETRPATEYAISAFTLLVVGGVIVAIVGLVRWRSESTDYSTCQAYKSLGGLNCSGYASSTHVWVAVMLVGIACFLVGGIKLFLRGRLTVEAFAPSVIIIVVLLIVAIVALSSLDMAST